MNDVLQTIIEAHSIDNLKVYIENNPSLKINNRNQRSKNALIYCAEMGFVEGVEYLLTIPHINIEIKDKYDRTALYTATNNGGIEIVKLLLGARANIETRDYTKKTVFAHSVNNIEIMKELLTYDPDIHATDIDDKSIFFNLCSSYSTRSSKRRRYMLIKEAIETLVQHAQKEDIKKFIDESKKIDVNSKYFDAVAFSEIKTILENAELRHTLNENMPRKPTISLKKI